jgi:uncharacterized membrane protein
MLIEKFDVISFVDQFCDDHHISWYVWLDVMYIMRYSHNGMAVRNSILNADFIVVSEILLRVEAWYSRQVPFLLDRMKNELKMRGKECQQV